MNTSNTIKDTKGSTANKLKDKLLSTYGEEITTLSSPW